MWRVSVRAVAHYPQLFAGMFVALALGVTVIGVSAAALLAAIGVPTTAAGPALTLPVEDGTSATVHQTTDELGALISVLGIGATVSGFVTIMVVSGAAALSVALRRRDFGLLRLVGCSGGAVRRMVLTESLVVALPAVLVGCAAVVVSTPWAFARLNETRIAPVAIAPGSLWLPLAIAAGSGLLFALAGVLLASGAATRTPPTAALREADLDSGRLTVGRAVVAALALVGGAVMVVTAAGTNDDSGTPLAIFGTVFLAVAACAAGPAYLAGVLRLLMMPVRWVDPVAGRLAGQSVTSARRRTASLVAPVLAVLAVVGIFATVLETSAAGTRADVQARNAAQLEVAAPNGLTESDLAAMRATPGVDGVAAPVEVDVAVSFPWGAHQEVAAAVDLVELSKTNRFDVTAGKLAPLGRGEVAVGRELADWYDYRVGGTLTYGIFGGQAQQAVIAAVIDGGISLPSLLLPADAASERPSSARIRLSEGASDADVRGALARELGTGVEVTSVHAVVDATQAEQDRTNWIALLVLALPASVYAIIGIASTIVMAAGRRGRETATMRLLGVSRDQVLRVAAWEAVGTTVAGIILAVALVAAGTAAFHASVPVYGGAAPLRVPWILLVPLALGCLVTNVVVGLLSTARLLGRADR